LDGPKIAAVQHIAPKASPLVRDVHSGPVPLPPVAPEIANRPSEMGSGNDFRIGKYGQWDPFIHARDLGGLGILDPGLEGKDGAMTGRGFAAPGNTGGSGIGPERALEAITPSPRAQRESIPLFELPCERRPGPAEPDTKAHHRTS
jgi:hypothetical protein